MAQHWSAATTTTNSKITVLLAALGTLWVSYQLYQFATFVHFNFLRSSKLARYQKRSPDGKPTSWALITGSSDGIGKGFAQELCRRGFNVILHGRNEQKLKAVKAELEQQWPDSQIKIIVFDAGTGFRKDPAGLEPVIASISDLKITVLINNIGGGPSPPSLPLGESSANRVREMIDANATITTEITRLLIPILAKRSPALIMTVGSFAGIIGVPYVSLYSGVKAYGEAMSKALHVEMKLENHGIEVIHLQLGKVKSGREADTVRCLPKGSLPSLRDSRDKETSADCFS